MATATVSAQSPAQRQWFITGRWQAFDGEANANLVRIVAVGLFYIVELIRFYGLPSARADQLPFHRQATAIAVAWTLISLAILLLLRLRVFPAGLRYVSTGCDLVLLTTLAALTGGPFSPLVAAYFVVIALAALRFSAPLVWITALASICGYWLLVGLVDKKWFDADHAVPVTTQLITALSLALTGVILGQVVLRTEAMAHEYSARLSAAREVS